MIKRLVLVILLLALLFGGVFGWKYLQLQQSQALQSQPPPPATVSSAEVTAMHWQPTLSAVGSVVAINGTDVTTEVAGKVEEIRFKSGERVAKGDILVQLDATVDRADLDGLKADMRLAELQLERNARLLPRRAISQSAYDETKAQYESAKAKVAAQEALINKKTIRAPFAGLLGIREVNLGQYLSPGTKIVQIQQLTPIFVDYTLPERHLNQLQEGQAVQVTVSAYPNETFVGRITAVDAAVNPATRSIQTRATLQNPDGRLRPGMFAEVTTEQGAPRQVLTIPRTAVSYNPYGDFVFLITQSKNGDKIAQRTQITTGATQQGRVEILKGLEAGQQVVQAGQQKLRNGQPIRIDNSVALKAGEVVNE
ncbi:MAG: efflux RND transporter periplasmic adaptor subunit [Nitrococcus mobilis]|nr:efflux RND transporter periplasmic adaptor subunit [Nitrococcus mobilis]